MQCMVINRLNDIFKLMETLLATFNNLNILPRGVSPEKEREREREKERGRKRGRKREREKEKDSIF